MRVLRRVAVLTLAAGLLAAPAMAADKKRADDGTTRPQKADWYASWPAKARAEGLGGWAAMRCQIQDDGTLSACTVVREQPAGRGFGDALLSLAPKYRYPPPKPNQARGVVLPGDWFDYDTPPDWQRRPTARDLIAVVPRDAAKKGVGGKATITCMATIQGTLTDCFPIFEEPAGMGFGGAAVALAPQFLMKPARKNGAPVPSIVSIPINWPADGMRFVASAAGPGKKVAPPNLAWAEAPSFADVAAAYPAKAREARVGGHTILACDMTEEGRLKSCDAGSTSPSGYGFDTAAKALAKQFRYPISTDADRKATREVSVHLPVTFDPSMLAGGDPVVGKPSWAAVPGGNLLTEAFSKHTGVARATLSCKVQQGGRLDACSIVSEEPAGAGTGQAALSLVPAFRLSTWTTEGLPTVGAVVKIPIRYEGREAAAKPPS
jgi:TonB family protein